jgi:ABC-type uncharacterized transport system involved in gliding motility auxiliary subunit
MRATSKAAGLAGALLGGGTLYAAAYYPSEKLVVWALGLVAAAVLVSFLVVERRSLARVRGSRAVRHGANAAAMTLAFLGILVIVNVLAFRHNKKWDTTSSHVYALSAQTTKILAHMQKDVNITAFFIDSSQDSEQNERRRQLRRLLDDYKDETPHLCITFVDPEKRPDVARKYGIREYGTTVFESGSQTYRTTEVSEEAITNALVRITRQGKKVLCFTSGHGEHGLDETQRTGYQKFKRVLEEQGFDARELLLARESEVPKDCDVLVVAGPGKPFLEREVGAVRAYLGRGGHVLLLADAMADTGLDGLLSEWGVRFPNDVILDPKSSLSITTPILTPPHPSHEITKDLALPVVLPLARSLEVATVLPKGITYAPILRTADACWGETNLREEHASFDPKVDLKGPLTAAAIFEAKEVFGPQDQKAAAQLLVVGNSEFADNTYFDFYGNGDLVQNMVSYLAKEQDLVSIRPKDTKPSPLLLSRAGAAAIFLVTLILAPLATIVAGLGIWWKRKNL